MKMILIRGLPGSGKSTLAKKIQYQMGGIGYAHLEADQFFYDEHGKYNFDPSKLHQAHQRCLYNARVCLEGDQPVIVSNTFTTKKELKPYFDLAFEFNICPTILLAQNFFGSIHDVPDDKMKQMRERFQFDLHDMVIGHSFKLLAKTDNAAALGIFAEALSVIAAKKCVKTSMGEK